MTNKEIQNAVDRLEEASKLPHNDQLKALGEIADDLKCNIVFDRGADHRTRYNTIHAHLQSNMMLNACVSAENSSKRAKIACFWAALAAIASVLSIVIAFLSDIMR